MRALAVFLATVGPVGHLPVASGTAGSLVAVPLLPVLAVLRGRSAAAYAVVLLGLVVLAIWAADRAEETLEGHDHSAIVIDEVAGMVVAGVFVPGEWTAIAIAFVLFRLFDVTKPFPAGRIDGYVGGGLGVVGDDLVAGVYAGLATALVLRLV